MKQSKSVRKILKGIKGDALRYFAEKAGNLEFLELLSYFEEYISLSESLNCKAEYEEFYKNYSEALEISMDKGKIVFDDYYYYLIEKICFPEGVLNYDLS